MLNEIQEKLSTINEKMTTKQFNRLTDKIVLGTEIELVYNGGIDSLPEDLESSISRYNEIIDNSLRDPLILVPDPKTGKFDDTMLDASKDGNHRIHSLKKIDIAKLSEVKSEDLSENLLSIIASNISFLKYANRLYEGLLIDYRNFSSLHNFWDTFYKKTDDTKSFIDNNGISPAPYSMEQGTFIILKKNIHLLDTLSNALYTEAKSIREKLVDFAIEPVHIVNYLNDNFGSELGRWRSTEDASIKPKGKEFISPPFKYSDFIAIIPDACDYLVRQGCYPNGSCGYHIGMSLNSGIDIHDHIRDTINTYLHRGYNTFTAVYLTLQQSQKYLLSSNPSRRDSKYAYQLGLEAIKELNNSDSVDKNYKALTPSQKLDVLLYDPNFLESEASTILNDKYSSTNVQHSTHLEIRTLGGREGFDIISDKNKLELLLKSYLTNLTANIMSTLSHKDVIKIMSDIIKKYEVSYNKPNYGIGVIKEKKIHGLISKASNPSTPEGILKILAGNKNSDVRFNVALNPNTPIEALTILASDEEPRIRHAVIYNPNTPVEIIKTLADDEDRLVRYAARRNYGED